MFGLSAQATYDLQNAAVALLLLLFIAYATMLMREHQADKCRECGEDLNREGRCRYCLDAPDRDD